MRKKKRLHPKAKASARGYYPRGGLQWDWSSRKAGSFITLQFIGWFVKGTHEFFDQAPPGAGGCYVDGFNLYFGLHDEGLRRYYWLNLRSLAENLLRPNQVLVQTKYFTARISGATADDPPQRAARLNAKRKRQSDFLESLETVENLSIYEGHYLAKSVRCRNCGASWRSHEEKMTDVNIATEMLIDALHDRLDTALVVSADSDLGSCPFSWPDGKLVFSCLRMLCMKGA